MDSPNKKHKPHDSNRNASSNVQVRLQNTDSFTTYRKKNEHLTIERSALPAQFGLDHIDDDDEIWLCDIPHGIDVKQLIGKSIKLGGTSKTIATSDGNQLECVSEVRKCDEGADSERISLVVQDTNARLSIRNVDVHGRITFRHKLDGDAQQPLEIEDNIEYKAGTDFPTGLRVRHPLYGFQFDRFIELDGKVQRRLNHIRDNIRCESAPKQVVVKAEPEPSKKTKKRKAVSVDEAADDVDSAAKRPKIKAEPEAMAPDLDWIRQI